MRRFVPAAAIPAAFAAGLAVSHLTGWAFAQTQAPRLTAQIIDVSSMTDADIGPLVPNLGTLRSRTLVAAPDGTISIQAGNVPKHIHLNSDEIQYVIAGTGTFWLGSQQRDIHPGDLIIIPRGTPHAGSVPSSGEFKVLAIKLPPQEKGDMHLVP